MHFYRVSKLWQSESSLPRVHPAASCCHKSFCQKEGENVERANSSIVLAVRLITLLGNRKISWQSSEINFFFHTKEYIFEDGQ